jgi:hypothetical protein
VSRLDSGEGRDAVHAADMRQAGARKRLLEIMKLHRYNTLDVTEKATCLIVELCNFWPKNATCRADYVIFTNKGIGQTTSTHQEA